MTLPEIHQILKEKVVGVAGCGGLGSNCAISLARAGIGKLIIADFDLVSKENLNRQYYFTDQTGMMKVVALRDNIWRVNPEVVVEFHPVKLEPENLVKFFNSCHVMVEAFDQADQKQMLIETFLMELPGKPLVIGSGIAGWGKNELLTCRNIDNLYICGDETTEISGHMPPLAPRVGVVGNMQANTVLQIILDGEK